MSKDPRLKRFGLSGFNKPTMHLVKTDLPDPEAPITTNDSP